ncbi:hypothetical protein CLF_101331 [Clonorchis sinensis]|uniref:Neuroblast differentiation-associated protein AHNAK n=1 Tax=Clonorchis sinensis TaxID=79923 RepID=G7Y5I3_CLOSI|nr:hypothetical protein CLF_101331 [Clonorchis sinensis]
MDGRKNRGRRKRRSRTSAQQLDEPDGGPTLDAGNIMTSSQSDNGTDSSNGVGGDTVSSGLDNSMLVRSKWETYPTPPMETSSSTEQVLIPTSDLPPDDHMQQESMGLHTEPDKQFFTPVNEHHESTVGNDLNMSEEVLLVNNAGEHTPKQVAHHVEEASLQETGEASCDIFTENGFVPIHLPLSSELYTPAYCVHATDQCELETPDKSDLIPGESKSFVRENDEGSGLPLSTLQDERNHIERLEDSGEIDIISPSETEIPTELIEDGLSVLPKVQPGINNQGVKVCVSSTTPSGYVCTGSEEETVGKPKRTKGRSADNKKRVITKVSSDLQSPTASTEKKRWKPNFSWLKGDLKLASGTYEPEVMLSKSQIYPAQDKGENHLVSVTLKPDDEVLQKTEHTTQENSKSEINSRKKEARKDRHQTKNYSLSCIEIQKKRNKLKEQENEKDERTQTERKSKRGKKRKLAPGETDEATKNREVQERKISLAITTNPETHHYHIKKVDEKIFTEGELNQLITDMDIETQQENIEEHHRIEEGEVREATIKRQKDQAWLQTATIEAFRDIEAELNAKENQRESEKEKEKGTKEKTRKKPAINPPKKQEKKYAKKGAKTKNAAAAGADASLDADVRLPEVSVDVAADVDGTGKAGAKGRGFKFPWSPKIKLGKGKLGKGDLAADAKLEVSGPSVGLPSAQASLTGPQFDVRVPDVSVGGDLGAQADVGGVADVSVSGGLDVPEVSAPDLSGEFALPAVPSSLDVDVSMPTVQVDATAPGVQVSVPQLKSPDVGVDVGLGGVGQVDANAQLDAPDLALKKPKFGFSFGKKAKKPKAVAPGVEVPGAGVDASVSLPAVDTSVSGAVELPNAEVSMPAKKRGFGFGFGSKGKGAKKVAKPKIAAAAGADASLDADVRLPEVSVDVAADVDGTGKAGAKGRGFKFPWSPKIKLGKGKLGEVDLTAEIDSVAPASLAMSDSSVPFVSVSSAFSPYVVIPGGSESPTPVPLASEPVLNVSVSRPHPSPSRFPSVHSAVDDNLFSSTDADLILSDIHLSDLSAPSPRSVVSETIVSQTICDGGRRDFSGTISPTTAIPEAFADVVALASSEPFAFPNASFKLDSSDPQCLNNFVPANVAVPGPDITPIKQGSSPLTNSRDALFVPAYSPGLSVSQELKVQPPEEPITRHDKFWGLRLHGHPKPARTRDQLYKQAHGDVSPTEVEIQAATPPCADELFDPSFGHIHPLDFSITDGDASEMESSYNKQAKVDRGRSNFSLPRVFGSLVRRKHRSPADVGPITDQNVDQLGPVSDAHPDESVEVKKKRRPKKSRSGPKRKPKRATKDATLPGEIDKPSETPLTPRTPSGKPKDLYSRQTWHGDDEFRRLSRDEIYNLEFGEPPQVPPTPTGFRITPVLRDPGNIMDVRRRSTTDSAKRRPWSTVGLPPPGCKFVNDDYLFPDALTPTKIPSFRGSREIVYNVPYMDDQALPLEEPEWPIGESRRTLLSQLSQKSEGMVHIAAEEESSVISLAKLRALFQKYRSGDDKENRFKDTSEKPSRVSLLFARKSRSKSKKADTCEPHEQSASHSRHSAKLALKLNRLAQSER